MPTSRPGRSDSERGASLVLALIVLIAGAFIVVGLASYASANMTDTSALQQQRSLEYAADAALEGAVQSNRYNPGEQTGCRTYPASGQLQVSSNAYVFVSCQGTPFTGLSVQKNSSTISGPSGTFVSAAQGLGVYDTVDSPSPIPPGTVLGTVSADGSTATMVDSSGLAVEATATVSNVSVATAGKTVDRFWACSSTSPITSCSSGSALGSALVQYYDTNSVGTPTPGFAMSVTSWDVKSADH